jgi:hypothetical protein
MYKQRFTSNTDISNMNEMQNIGSHAPQPYGAERPFVIAWMKPDI